MNLSLVASAFLPFIVVTYAAPAQTGLKHNTDEFPLNEATSHDEEEMKMKLSCNLTCEGILQNALCNAKSKLCECTEEFPIKLHIGCTKPLQLDEQCLYSESCALNDPFSACLQINYNAYCRCIVGYHKVSLQKQLKKDFCTRDMLKLDKSTRTLILLLAGVAVFSTLICFVLRLFAGKSSNRRTLAVNTRLLSTAEIAQVARSFHRPNQDVKFTRRGSYGVTVPCSRVAAARAAAILLVSCNIPAQELSRRSSVNKNIATQSSNSTPSLSFSSQKFKRENDMKVARSQQLYRQQLSTSSFETASFTD